MVKKNISDYTFLVLVAFLFFIFNSFLRDMLIDYFFNLGDSDTPVKDAVAYRNANNLRKVFVMAGIGSYFLTFIMSLALLLFRPKAFDKKFVSIILILSGILSCIAILKLFKLTPF